MPAIRVIYSILSNDHLLGDYEKLVTSSQELVSILKKKGLKVYAFLEVPSRKELFDGQTDKIAQAAAKKYLRLK